RGSRIRANIPAASIFSASLPCSRACTSPWTTLGPPLMHRAVARIRRQSSSWTSSAIRVSKVSLAMLHPVRSPPHLGQRLLDVIADVLVAFTLQGLEQGRNHRRPEARKGSRGLGSHDSGLQR